MTDAIFHMIADAPKPVAPYSHVVEKDGWLFVTSSSHFATETLAQPLLR
ncbi:MAG TPA: hypothetical protein VME47_13050 [Acetobacteraceae bacterium]|nr:hypothetical protein [Acetobacteraceae bacterium]